LAQNNGQHVSEGIARVILGRIIARMDPSCVDSAIGEVLAGIKITEGVRTEYSRGHFYLGELYADTGQEDNALEALKKAEAEFKDMGMDYWLRKTQEVLERVKS
jgi:hypothetical protein